MEILPRTLVAWAGNLRPRVSEKHFTGIADALRKSFPERLYLTI
jgi:hypothetical protein